MGTHRAHIVLPEALIAEINSLVGPRGRSAFLVETAQAELRRRRLVAFFSRTEPAWKEEDHPELADGVETWVKKLRSESNHRLEDAEEARQPKA